MPEDVVVAALRAAGCVFAEDEAALLRDAAGDPETLAAMVARRVAGEPLEHLVGWAELDGVRVRVGPGVFVPRRRTAALVGFAMAGLPTAGRVLDLCCGSGGIALVLATRRPDLEVYAADVDQVAVEWARGNLAPFGAQVHGGDLFAALPSGLAGSFDLITANVPYVPSAAASFLPPEAREHEPRHTWDGGDDGLDVLRRVLADAPDWLRPAGRVLFEIGADQADAAITAATRAGLHACADHDAEWDTTVLVARVA